MVADDLALAGLEHVHQHTNHARNQRHGSSHSGADRAQDGHHDSDLDADGHSQQCCRHGFADHLERAGVVVVHCDQVFDCHGEFPYIRQDDHLLEHKVGLARRLDPLGPRCTLLHSLALCPQQRLVRLLHDALHSVHHLQRAADGLLRVALRDALREQPRVAGERQCREATAEGHLELGAARRRVRGRAADVRHLVRQVVHVLDLLQRLGVHVGARSHERALRALDDAPGRRRLGDHVLELPAGHGRLARRAHVVHRAQRVVDESHVCAHRRRQHVRQ
mmetsp:Transcript_22079/g.71069  ORF Transcript_22079/g.71069 Transcript_22079/m.71069 type:complete len:278 (-) Transcript_22079:1032-1865(-)